MPSRRLFVVLWLVLSAVEGFILPHGLSANNARSLPRTVVIQRRLKSNPDHLLVPEAEPVEICQRQEPSKRQQLLSRVVKTTFRVLPKKRKLVCLAIAVMAYIRGPTALIGGSSSSSSQFDPNVAHAGVSVKVSGVKVQATLNDRMLSSPRGSAPVSARPKSKSSRSSGVAPQKSLLEKSADAAVAQKNAANQKAVGSRMTQEDVTVTILLSASSGIIVAKFAREKHYGFSNSLKSYDEEGLLVNGQKLSYEMEKARRQKADDYVKKILKKDVPKRP